MVDFEDHSDEFDEYYDPSDVENDQIFGEDEMMRDDNKLYLETGLMWA